MFTAADVLADDLESAARALLAGETDFVANMANLAALIYHTLPDLNWAGFYLLHNDVLVLGPFQGKPACVRIAVGKGVCGTAIATRTAQLVPDVHAFPGHIACDAASRAELVIPFWRAERLAGVLDLDSPLPNRFSERDLATLQSVVRLLDC